MSGPAGFLLRASCLGVISTVGCNDLFSFCFYSLMHDADKLMSRCVYMNILTATIEMAKEEENSSEILDKYAANTMELR